MASAGMIFLVLTLFSSSALGMDHKEWGDNDWTVFIIGTSCNIETLLPDGQYDEKASEICGKCFEKLEAEGNGADVVRNCSATFLPKILAQCNSVLAEDTRFEQFWEEALKCFYGYVIEKDTDGHIQADMKKWVKEHPQETHDSGNEKKWEFLIGSSCLTESRQDDGSFDHNQADQCGQCFVMHELKTCMEEFLPRMTVCADVLYEDGEDEGLACLENHLDKLDVDGEARRMMKEYLGMENSWTG